MAGVSFEEQEKFVSASDDGKVKLSNLATKGRDSVKLEGHEGSVEAVGVSAGEGVEEG